MTRYLSHGLFSQQECLQICVKCFKMGLNILNVKHLLYYATISEIIYGEIKHWYIVLRKFNICKINLSLILHASVTRKCSSLKHQAFFLLLLLHYIPICDLHLKLFSSLILFFWCLYIYFTFHAENVMPSGYLRNFVKRKLH